MIEVRRPHYPDIFEQPVHFMTGVMNELKRRGAPVVGGISITSVSTGHIEMFMHNGERVYRYYKEGEARQPLPAPVAEEDDGEL